MKQPTADSGERQLIDAIISHTLDRLGVAFDDARLVADAGLLLPATLAAHLGLRELVEAHLDPGSAAGRANAGDKVLTLVASALAGGDCIDEVLMARLRGAAHFLAETIGRVRHGGASGALTVRADSGFYAHAVVAVCRRMNVSYSITVRLQPKLRGLIEAIPEADWTPIPYWMGGGADVAETTYSPFAGQRDAVPMRLIVRRVRPGPGSQLALFATYSYHAFITDRDGATLELEADHRRHAEIENAIRDLKYGVGLNHLPTRWPWATNFTAALTRLRALPLLA